LLTRPQSSAVCASYCRQKKRPGLAEARVLGGDGDVADHLEHVAAADRDAVDGRDHRLGNVAQGLVQLLELPQAVLAGAVAAGLGVLLLVAARAERPVAGAGQDHARHRPVGPGALHRVQQLADGAAAERVQALGPVDGDYGAPGLDPVQHVGVAHGVPRAAQPAMVSPPLTDSTWPVM
jgi:hypothetical protein